MSLDKSNSANESSAVLSDHLVNRVLNLGHSLIIALDHVVNCLVRHAQCTLTLPQMDVVGVNNTCLCSLGPTGPYQHGSIYEATLYSGSGYRGIA